MSFDTGCLFVRSERGEPYRSSTRNNWKKNPKQVETPATAGTSTCVTNVTEDSNLVDSARSHTLVSKIKPCMSKYKRSCTVKLRMAHYISYSLFDSPLLHGYP